MADQSETRNAPERSPWRVVRSRKIVNSPWVSVEEQACLLPNGQLLEPFYLVHQPDWVLVLPRTVEGLWILESQYRHGVGRYLLEFPAGIINAGESALEAGRRELREETGWSGGEWRLLQILPVNPDRQSSRVHIVWADGLRDVGHVHWDSGEEIATRMYSTAEIDDLIANGILQHPHHIAAWMLNRKLW